MIYKHIQRCTHHIKYMGPMAWVCKCKVQGDQILFVYIAVGLVMDAAMAVKLKNDGAM